MKSEAVRLILVICARGLHRWVTSEIIEDEVIRNPDVEKRIMAIRMLTFADELVAFDDGIATSGKEYEAKGLSAFDALHLAAAEAGRCDVLLTTDERFLARAKKLNPSSPVKVENPVERLRELTIDGS